MKKKREIYVLYQDAVVCRLLAMTVSETGRTSRVQFDNGEIADVNSDQIRMTFDLEPEA